MPFVEVFTARQRTPEKKQQLLRITRTAVSEAFCVEEAVVKLWLHEFAGDNVLCPDAEGADAFLVHCFSGRSDAQKERLYAHLFQKLRDAGETEGTFQLTVEESPMKNWGLDGGISADVFLSDRPN